MKRVAFFVVAVCGAAAAAVGAGRETGDAVTAAPGSERVAGLVQELSTGSSGEVVRQLEAAASADPGNAEAHSLLSLGYQQLFRETARPVDLARARAALETAVELGGESFTTQIALAQISATQHRFRAAERHAREALRLEPGNASALGTLGDALVELGRYEEAFRSYDRAAAQGPSVAAYARVARARELLGRPTGALEALELAIEAGSGISEQQAWALTRYGHLLLSVGRVDDADVAFRRSLGLQPGFPHARAGIARAAAARGATMEAIRRYERLLQDTPSADYAIELGDLYLVQGREREADRAYERARRHEERLAASGVRTMRASAGLDLDRGLRLASALELARQAYREAPNVETEDLLAWALARNGRCREARARSER